MQSPRNLFGAWDRLGLGGIGALPKNFTRPGRPFFKFFTYSGQLF